MTASLISMWNMDFYWTQAQIILSLILCKVSVNAFCNVILSFKRIGSEKLDFPLFGQNIYYPDSFAQQAATPQKITIFFQVLGKVELDIVKHFPMNPWHFIFLIACWSIFVLLLFCYFIFIVGKWSLFSYSCLFVISVFIFVCLFTLQGVSE